jgi:hypothetical protein
MSLEQTALRFDDTDDLVIIGPARDAIGPNVHSTFRKIDMAVKQGKFVSLSWGELMVMLPRPLYERVLAYATRADHESRAAAMTTLFEAGLCD